MEQLEIEFIYVGDNGAYGIFSDDQAIECAEEVINAPVSSAEEACDIIRNAKQNGASHLRGVCTSRAEAARYAATVRIGIAKEKLSPAAASIAEDVLEYCAEIESVSARPAREALEDGEALAEKGWTDEAAVNEAYELLLPW